MLVLSRQRDETIMIGDEVEITVVDIRGDKVRIGITAPSRIAVHRKEVYEAIQRENQAAAGIGGEDIEPLKSAIRPGTIKPSGVRTARLRQAPRSESAPRPVTPKQGSDEAKRRRA